MRPTSAFLAVVAALSVLPLPACAQETRDAPAEDVINTSAGPLTLTFLGHGTLMFRLRETVVHVDPVMREANYAVLPKADLVLVTHEHGDHLDTTAIAAVRKPDTRILVAPAAEGRVTDAAVLRNGETREVAGLRVEAVPAYNVVHKRATGEPYHAEGQGNGYVITFGDTRVYVAGDTENTPAMKALTDIAVAFLPMNLPYTMTPEMVADAARAFRPRILYPYHYGDTDPQRLMALLADVPAVEVRIRDLR